MSTAVGKQAMGRSKSVSRRAAGSWARALGRAFKRVALFEISGTTARIVYLKGIDPKVAGRAMSLTAQTPLRWTIEAASPVIGSGSSPGGDTIAKTLGISRPRAFTVIPLVIGRRLRALAYADNAGSSLALGSVSALFQICDAALQSSLTGAETAMFQPGRETLIRHRPRSSARRPGIARNRSPSLEVPRREELLEEVGEIPEAVSEELAALNEVTQQATSSQGPQLGVVTPEGVIAIGPYEEPTRSAWLKPRLATAACLFAGLLGLLALWIAPPSRSDASSPLLEIVPGARVSEIAQQLQRDGLVRSSLAFTLLARMSGVDRSLRAGHYRIEPGLWAWEVVEELAQGQVHTVTVTVPEGLTLKQIAELMERKGLATEQGFIAATREAGLIQRYGLGVTSLEGFLYPETYIFAQGLAPGDLVMAMVDLFFVRLQELAPGRKYSPAELVETVTLASIVEREAQREDEMSRIAGVFINRLERNMRLESCATIQYVLGKSKDRLLLSDLRKESPYNTYLNNGLPPGPIANPGSAALRATLGPERHEYLFFFARKDGTRRHVFHQTYAQHQKALVRQRQSGKI